MAMFKVAFAHRPAVDVLAADEHEALLGFTKYFGGVIRPGSTILVLQETQKETVPHYKTSGFWLWRKEEEIVWTYEIRIYHKYIAVINSDGVLELVLQDALFTETERIDDETEYDLDDL